MRPNPNLVVLDLDKIHPEVRREIETIWYEGILSAEVLAHLTACAREREQRDGERLSELLTSGEPV